MMTDAEERVLTQLSPELQELVQRLRRIVKQTIPEAEERAHPGWSNFNYYLNGELGYVGGSSDVAIVGFTRGIDLSDSDGVLTATRGSKHMRRLVLRPGDDIPVELLKSLWLQAVEINLRRGPHPS